ncbi:family 49 glycosyl hydrolase [Streptomyces sp. NPDC050703]|uniref:family 49 glycosyl hydrolase n=1 Tax=Streptomyces sp. NPDC050703 TaxID=3157218 RepID=UPI003414E800
MPAARLNRLAALAAGLALALACVVMPTGVASARPLPAPAANTAAASAVTTSDSAQLKTWWHDNHEFNTTSPVASDKVRRSSFYDVRVATAAAPSTRYDSFAYMSIPRSGKGKIGYTKEDGAEFSSSADLTMSWSSFQYSADVWVDVSLRGGQTISSADQVKIKPSSLDFAKELVDSTTVRVKVPYDAKGYRFSVEFDPQLYTAYNDMSGPANDAGKLTTQGGGGNRAVHTEPRNSMMIFAEPALTGAEKDRLIPTSSSGSIHYPQPGKVTDLNTISEEIVYFRPGTYDMTSKYHALLPKQVKWVYLAPGAYVKGAIRFPDDSQSLYKVTGYGVLSGERYVYEADTNNNYDHLSGASNCHSSCVKMLQFASAQGRRQHLDLQGVTINEPPYHSFVVYGDEQTFGMRVNNYKQVGSWYWQTDGIELYRGSTMKNTFFNANDDVLKMYHSDVDIDNTVIWKNENGPVIQWGWTPRNIDNVRVNNTHVIHNRMYWKDVKYNTCILNSSSHWEDMGSTSKADPSTTVKNMTFENITVEGMTNCAIRVFALSSTENIHVKNLKIGAWNQLDAASQVSLLKRHSNSAGQKVSLGNETRDSRGLKLENYTVGGTVIQKSGTNWSAEKLGRLGFDAENWDNWNAWGPGGNNPDPATRGTIKNGGNSKCVHRADDGTANGTAIQQRTCADNASMIWTLDGQQLKSGGKCLDLEYGGTANGTKTHLWDCGTWDSQKWAFQTDGTLKNLKSGRCLDIEDKSTADGARLHLWDCGDWSSQKWTLTS